jgi:hypothetical protein
MKQTRRSRQAVEQEATVRLARFERSEAWQGLSPGDPVRIAGHRGGTWRFRAFVTNTSNGASWVEVSEVMAAGRRRRASAPVDPAEDGPAAATTMTRVRSFRPELVTPLKKGRRRSAPEPPEPPAPLPAPLQSSLFEGH